MSSLDFCVCGGSKNPNQEVCGECRMAEIESLTLRHTWQEEPADEDYPDPDIEELNKCGACNKPTKGWFCKACYEPGIGFIKGQFFVMQEDQKPRIDQR